VLIPQLPQRCRRDPQGIGFSTGFHWWHVMGKRQLGHRLETQALAKFPNDKTPKIIQSDATSLPRWLCGEKSLKPTVE